LRTRFTELVGCELPLQLATLGGVGTTELAAAVASSGGLGMVPGGVDLPACSGNEAAGAGFLMPFEPSRDVVADAARRARVVEFFYGAPSTDLVRTVHDAGALCAWQVGSPEEAMAAEAAGCDLVVAQGREAGGHVRGTTPLRLLLPAVLGRVTIPMVAAGGVATAESVAELLVQGAAAVRIGTRFAACEESAAHPDYVAALIAARSAADTVLTTHFGEGWPDAPHRVLRVALEKAERSGNRGVGPPSRYEPGDVSDRAMYAGEGVAAITQVSSARDVVRELVRLLD